MSIAIAGWVLVGLLCIVAALGIGLSYALICDLSDICGLSEDEK